MGMGTDSLDSRQITHFLATQIDVSHVILQKNVPLSRVLGLIFENIPTILSRLIVGNKDPILGGVYMNVGYKHVGSYPYTISDHFTCDV